MIDSILEKLKDDRAVEITREGDSVHFDEMCDMHFRCTLTLDEARTLGHWIVEMASPQNTPNLSIISPIGTKLPFDIEDLPEEMRTGTPEEMKAKIEAHTGSEVVVEESLNAKGPAD